MIELAVTLPQSLTRFLQATVEGLSLAAIYALLALGFVIIYKSTQVLNFAQPALLIFGAYMASYLSITWGWGFWIGVLVAIALTAGLGAGLERVAMRPMVGKPVFAAAILTLGLDIGIRVFVNDLIGVNVRAIGDPPEGGFGAPGLPWPQLPWNWGGVIIQPRSVVMVITTGVLVMALLYFFRRSRFGLAMRATAIDQEVALAQGINVGGVFSMAWILGGAMAAVAGVFGATAFAGLSASNAIAALKALPAVVVGGLDSINGAVVGALIIGLAEAYTATYQAQYAPWLGSNFSQVVPYVVMLLVLLVRPYGLFGTEEVERV
ncbi:MAG: branched-chain amino acid ABC transporter permease [Acidimicrobiia bacterium]|nr:branched-chain amino acid ABC transporter permease [Acidimicrobiia bacterium]NNF70043.1 branched-chain amino acid ABC transporter permease [Acidimicrobiia bacterium]NNK90962.1 branched-chain amino acid ABC transporter permease [Acidimicrobiia bacterium]